MLDTQCTSEEITEARPTIAVLLEAVVQESSLGHPDLTVVMPSPAGALGETPILEAIASEIHAGQAETSYELYLNPDHVTDEWTDCIPPVGRGFLDYAVMEVLAHYGVWGKPSLASVEKGRQPMELRRPSLSTRTGCLPN